MSTSEQVETFEQWLTWTFDRPVERHQWYWDAARWPGGNDAWPFDRHGRPGPDAARVAEYLTRLFGDPAPLIERYALTQVAQGLDLLGSGAWSITHVLFERSIPLEARLRCVSSFESLYRLLFAEACDPELSHCRASSNPLNGVCYMWWDLLPNGVELCRDTRGEQIPPENKPVQQCMLRTMKAILSLEHPACREGALHGLGHFQEIYPREVAQTIRDFLAANAGLSDDLRRYAEFAAEGHVQ